MKKNIILILITILFTNLSQSQIICNISPKVKEAGEAITKKSGNKNDLSIIGDYRINGNGWILLPDHTGANFIKNIQTNQILWTLGNINGNIGLEIMFIKNELSYDNKLEAESQIKFLINSISDTRIEFINTKTLQSTKLKRVQLIPGKVYSQIQNKNNKQKPIAVPFSIFQKKYVDEQISNWQKKGEFEKTTDWQTRVNEVTRKEKIEDFNEDAIEAYANSLHIKLGFCYSGASLSLGLYDADKEIYIIKSKDFGNLEVPVPISEAEEFKYKSWCSDDSDPTNVIYFIKNNELSLAQATFWGKYKYENPLAKNRSKTKKEIEIEIQAKKGLDAKIYRSEELEKKPDFPGGMVKFYKYLENEYKSPKEEGLQGKVYVTFVIDVDGSLTDIKVLRDIGYGTKEEAIRVLSQCNKWIPGEIGGQKVKASYSLSITVNTNK